jgi:isopentenyl-diphosphate delta-isomerase
MTEHDVVDVFVARAGPDLRLCIDPAEVMATRWLGLDELRGEIAQNPDDFSPWLKIYLADHHEKIFGHAAITDL